MLLTASKVGPVCRVTYLTDIARMGGYCARPESRLGAGRRDFQRSGRGQALPSPHNALIAGARVEIPTDRRPSERTSPADIQAGRVSCCLATSDWRRQRTERRGRGQHLREQRARHRGLGHLEDHGAAATNDPGADLHQPLAQRRQRPPLGVVGQRQGAQKLARL